MNFNLLLNDTVILRTKQGIYREARLYEMDSDLYAAYGGGFIKLHANKDTSNPNVFWAKMSREFPVGKLGRLSVVA